MEEVTNWERVKEFYKQEFGVEEWVVELYANLDVLLLCASGASNESISKFTDIPVEDVIDILEKTFNFNGWEIDLVVNPYKCYLDEKNTEQIFKEFMKTLVDVKPELIFNMCKTMKEIEDKIRDEWI